MISKPSIIVCILCAIVSPLVAARGDDRAANPRTVYFTVGDYQDLPYTPLDSAASIRAAFDVLHDKYGVECVWWRGGQDEVWGKQFEIREQSRHYAKVWDWWKDNQYRKVNTNGIAVKEGHARGMQVWMAYGLFDNGSPPDVGFGGFPYAAEDKIRIEHPEWAPVNKYGTWRQGGPIEFAYPGARKAMVDYLAKYVIDGGYDGIAFLTYCENYSMRYEYEFGYSQPIVDEFKKRYGVDIRTQTFDRDAWAKLRGEYLTQFMRELHAALAKEGRKIAVSADGLEPHLPCKWNVGGGVRTVGRLWMDIDAWVKDGLIDELNLYYPNSDASLASVQKLCAETSTKVSIFGHTRGDLPAGVNRIMTVNTELESGFDWDRYVDFPDENVTPLPNDSLTSKDVYARRRVLTAIQRGKQKAAASDVVPLLADPDVYVRRVALRALVTLKDPSVIPAMEKCLVDPENGVRCQAAISLGQMGAAGCVKSLMEIVARPDSTYQFNVDTVPTVVRDLNAKKGIADADVALLLSSTSDHNDTVREVAWSSIRVLRLRDSHELSDAVLRSLREDKDPYVRELALQAIYNLNITPEIIEQVRKTLSDDKDEVVQVRAAMVLAAITRSAGSPAPLEQQTLKDLAAAFKRYGGDCQRSDKDWGWREVGNAIVMLGSPGDETLHEFMRDKEDKRLADLAWRVLYLRQEDRFCFVTEAQDAEAHANHPWMKFPKAVNGHD